MTVTNRSVELPIKSISQLRDFDISPERKTLIYVNAFHTADSYFSVQEHLSLLQKQPAGSECDCRGILARDVAQLLPTRLRASSSSVHGYCHPTMC
ncbi:GL20570 [Drosophila persimilis]|uniref:GL20570 n=1 Tax=Drosophila persimilis TaxID=7234 RepID=B4H194_DROPE|nr:GL20570 [Drosophila persimilis]